MGRLRRAGQEKELRNSSRPRAEVGGGMDPRGRCSLSRGWPPGLTAGVTQPELLCKPQKLSNMPAKLTDGGNSHHCLVSSAEMKVTESQHVSAFLHLPAPGRSLPGPTAPQGPSSQITGPGAVVSRTLWIHRGAPQGFPRTIPSQHPSCHSKFL